MHHNLPLIIALILMAGMLVQWLAWRLKQPSILFLLIIGIVAGPVTGVLHPDEVFGQLLFPAVSLGVALVLFEGALTLRFDDLRGHGASVSSLVTWGALINWLLISAGAWLLIDFSWLMALLFGALVVVTGPTVIMPLLRTVRPSYNVSNILRWEGILIDPIGALLAVLIFEVIIAGSSNNFWPFLARELSSGVVSGVIGGVVLGFLLKYHWVPEYLHNVFTLALVLTVFTVANSFAEESGLLAVTVMGIWLANNRKINIEEILSFKESLSILIISTLFIVLAARIDLSVILNLGWVAVGIIVLTIFARFVMVFASTVRSDLKVQEKLLLGWIAPRGIVAAAVSALFAFRLEEAGYENAVLLPALTFLVIIVTVVIQSVSAARIAEWLGVRAQDNGVLIVGGNAVVVTIGKALKEEGFRVKIATPNWNEIQNARMAGLETYFGSPVSAHADRYLDLVGFGQMFAMSMRPALNALASIKFKTEFGQRKVFTLRTSEEKDSSEKRRLAENIRVRRLFGEDATVQKLASLLSQGYEVKTTRLTETFGIQQFDEKYSNVIKLFAIDKNDRLLCFSDEKSPEPAEGWRLMFLYQREEFPNGKPDNNREKGENNRAVSEES